MSSKNLMRVALWTEIREALVKDFPKMKVPQVCPSSLEKVIMSNADYMLELAPKTEETERPVRAKRLPEMNTDEIAAEMDAWFRLLNAPRGDLSAPERKIAEVRYAEAGAWFRRRQMESKRG